MSKSLGNVVAPSQITKGKNPKGVDILRYWVGAHACQSNAIQVSDNIMESSKQDVDKIRNTMRFIIGNLNDQDFQQLNLKDMKLVDQYMLHQLRQYYVGLVDSYESMKFNKVCISTMNFVVNELSGFYFTIVKDRLYCDAKTSFERKSALSTLHFLGKYLTKCLSPILPVMVQEINQHCPMLEIDLSTSLDSVSSQAWFNNELNEAFKPIMEVRKLLNSQKVSWKSDDILLLRHSCFPTIFSTDDLKELWQVADVKIIDKIPEVNEEVMKIEHITADIFSVKTEKKLCPRCRLYASNDSDVICKRCQNVLQQ